MVVGNSMVQLRTLMPCRVTLFEVVFDSLAVVRVVSFVSRLWVM